MMENIPIHINLIFIVITVSTFGTIFYLTKKKQGVFNIKIGIIILAWLSLQSFLSLSGFYLNFDLFPPRFMFVIMPALGFVTLRIINGKDLPSVRLIGYIHIIRVPVEIILYFLAQEEVLPDIMTFRGRNFDIFAGVLLPLATYLYFEKRMISKNALIIFNFYGLVSLVNIVGHGILSAPTPFQQYGFNLPNIAIFHFPFIWLPAFIIPSILFAHLVTFKKLLRKRK